MKKVLVIGVILFLAACSSRMSGETTTVCADAPASLGLGEAVVTIEGMDENILVWTERTTMTRDEYNQLWQGIIPTEEDIRAWFDSAANDTGMQGVTWVLVSVDDETVVTDFIYNYEEMSESDLNLRWETDDFSREVTLTGAIAGLEDQDATCRTD